MYILISDMWIISRDIQNTEPSNLNSLALNQKQGEGLITPLVVTGYLLKLPSLMNSEHLLELCLLY